MRMLNLGCGKRYHPTWVNLDLTPVNKDVMFHNLKNNIPFPNNSCDVSCS